MNRVVLLVLRERIFPLAKLYHRQVFQPEVCSFSTLSMSSSTYLRKRHKYQQTSPVYFLSHIREMGFLGRMKERMYGYYSDATKVKIAGCLSYEKIADDINYKEFFQYFELPDTFQSWFIGIILHVHMVSLVTSSERHGRSFRNGLIDSMWHDVEQRLGRLATMRSSVKKNSLRELTSQFNAGIVSYDEGVLSDDTVLAAACWRMLFACQPVDPELLEKAVLYIRKQISFLDSQNIQNIILKGKVSFLPLKTALSDEM